MSDVDRGIETADQGAAGRALTDWPVPTGATGDWLDPYRLRLAAAFEREVEAGRGFLWLPVLFGVGILGYFALPAEPSLLALVVATGLSPYLHGRSAGGWLRAGLPSRLS